MTDTAATTHLTQVGTVFVPVADQDRALAFYREKLGFETVADFAYGEGSRWIEVAPPGSAVAIALVAPAEGGSAGGDQTRCAIATADIDADHAALRARGVETDAQVAREDGDRPLIFDAHRKMREPVPRMFFFRDVDGNRFVVVETT